MQRLFSLFIRVILVTVTILVIVLAAFFELISAESLIVASETPRIQEFLVQKLEHPIELHNVSLKWHGIIPVIDIHQLTLYSQDHKQKLFSVGEVLARIKIVESLIQGRVQVSYLYINHLNLLFAKEKLPDNNQSSWKIVNLEFLNTLFKNNLEENFSDKLTLECEHLGLGFQNIFPNYLPVTTLKARVNLDKAHQDISIHLKNIDIQNNDAKITGEAEYTNKRIGFNLKYHLNSTVPKQLNNYLPHTILDSDLLNWLVISIKSFNSIDGKALLQDDQFTAQFQVDHLNLWYAKDWPMAKNLDAMLNFKNAGLQAEVATGELAGVQLQNIDVNIPNFSHSILNIAGNISSESKLLQNFVLQSPLKLTLGQYFQYIDWTGNANLQINIAMPLEKNDQSKTKVTGHLKFSDNALKLMNKINLVKAKADINFNENGVIGKNLSAVYLESPVNINIFPNYYMVNYKQYHFRVNDKGNNRYRIIFSQPDILGFLEFQQKKIVGNFQVIALKSKPNESMNKKSSNMINPANIPESDISINDFRYDSKQFGSVKINTVPFNKGLKLQSLKTSLGSSTINLTGYWNNFQSSIQGSIVSHNLSELLDKWNFSNSIRSNSAKMNLQLNWQDSLYSPDVRSLSGNIQINIGSGELLNVGSEAKTDFGRLLTILSIQSIAKRLRFDFSDLNMKNKGLNFDNISGSFTVNNGIAKTNNLTLDGPVANINITGAMNLVSQTYNLNVMVTPHLTSSLPVIAAIAGGPVAGAAAWAAGKLFNPLLNKITDDNYTVTGPWKNPVIKQV
jgi:uncharacterized protein YhdP